jgi:hypothetical protein
MWRMDKELAIEILVEMQKWRRGKEPYDPSGAKMPFSPKEYGEALDLAILYLSSDFSLTNFDK